jgi:hypothetical protein
MKIRTKAPNFALTKELTENTNKSTKFWLKVLQDWALAREYDVDIEKYPICHANNKQVIMRCCPRLICSVSCLLHFPGPPPPGPPTSRFLILPIACTCS